MPDLFTPQREADYLQHVQAFAQNIASDPARYMLSAADSNALMHAVEEFATALERARTKATRTEVTVSKKNQMFNALDSLYRHYARQIRINSGIPDSDKIELGLHVPKDTRTPRKVPQTSPVLAFQFATIGEHHLTCRDSLSPESMARPFGAIALQLYVAIGDEAQTNPNHATFYSGITRSRFVVTHKPCDAKKTATYFGRWVGSRQDVGSWSLPLSVDIMFGGAEAAADEDEADDGEMKLAA